MQKVVLDTDLVIDYLRTEKGPLPNLLDDQRRGHIEIYISAVTVLELFAGQSSKKMLDEIQELIDQWRVVELSTNLGKLAGETKRDLKLNMTVTDLIIGSTSIWLKAKLATRNKKHFTLIPGIKFYKDKAYN